MKIYKVWQDDVRGYDTYSECVIIAEGINQAKRISIDQLSHDGYCWTEYIDRVHAKELGTANEDCGPGVVCASFHAG